MFIWLRVFLKGITREVRKIWSLTSPAPRSQKSGFDAGGLEATF